MNVTLVDSPQAFDDLRERWTALCESAAYASIFTTWSWQRLWWRHYGADNLLRIVLVEDAGLLVGLAPLYVQTARVFPGIEAAVLRFAGTGGDTAPDYLDPLIRRGYEERVAQLLARHVVGGLGGWDVARISDLHADSPFRSALLGALRDARLDCEEDVSARISYLSLPQTWDDYLGTLSRERRYTVRHARRKFESLPGARFFVWDDAATMDAAVDRLIELHHSRWKQRGEAHAFSSAAYVGFHRDVIHASREQNRLRIYCLEAEGAVIAMYYFYRFGDTLYYFQGGFEPKYERLRPGLCLMGYAIEHAIQEGNREFDMLRGEYKYKRQWAKQTRTTHQVVGYRRNPAALAYRLRKSYLPGIKQRMKRALSSVRGMVAAAPAAGSTEA
jgi:CelD/BcsL family acetyltransferase involved in cellulose biosynthesis